MKAIVCEKYGLPEVLELKEVEKPVPASNEVLVKIRASSVNFNVLAYMLGKPALARLIGTGLLKPKVKIPGGDIAGIVEAVGRKVKQFKPGDEVFANLDGCGYGAFAEYAAVPEDVLAIKPVIYHSRKQQLQFKRRASPCKVCGKGRSNPGRKF